MKLTEKKLRQIIREELQVLNALNENAEIERQKAELLRQVEFEVDKGRLFPEQLTQVKRDLELGELPAAIVRDRRLRNIRL